MRPVSTPLDATGGKPKPLAIGHCESRPQFPRWTCTLGEGKGSESESRSAVFDFATPRTIQSMEGTVHSMQV